VSGGTTGLTFSGGPITTSGTITLAGTLAVANGGTAASRLGGGPLDHCSGLTNVRIGVPVDGAAPDRQRHAAARSFRSSHAAPWPEACRAGSVTSLSNVVRRRREARCTAVRKNGSSIGTITIAAGTEHRDAGRRWRIFQRLNRAS